MPTTRTITIHTQREIANGISKTGEPWTLHEITAADEHGQPITQTLKTFDTLPAHETITVDVERQDHPKHGTSYLLKATRTQQQAALADRLARLEERVDTLEAAQH